MKRKFGTAERRKKNQDSEKQRENRDNLDGSSGKIRVTDRFVKTTVSAIAFFSFFMMVVDIIFGKVHTGESQENKNSREFDPFARTHQNSL